MEWNIDTSAGDGCARVIVRGDCDLYAAPAFVKAMLSRLENGEGDMRFDFTNVSYLDSSGVGAIIRIVQAARKIGTDIRFSGIGGSPRTVLRMANILPLLKEVEA